MIESNIHPSMLVICSTWSAHKFRERFGVLKCPRCGLIYSEEAKTGYEEAKKKRDALKVR